MSERRIAGALSIAHAAGQPTCRKSTLFSSGLTLRVELVNRMKAVAGSTLPTLPTRLARGVPKIDTLLFPTRAHRERGKVEWVESGWLL